MINVSVVTQGFTSINGVGFLFPLIFNIHNFRAIGIDIKFYSSIYDKRAVDADIFIVESKYIRTFYNKNKDKMLNSLNAIKQQVKKLIFFDITDSSGTLYSDLIPIVDVYCKSYIYQDKNLYKKSYYGGRLWTDYYHQKNHVKDNSEFFSTPVEDKYLHKIREGYLLGMINLSSKSIFLKNSKFIELMRKTGIIKLFSKTPHHNSFVRPSLQRRIDLSCRINLNYSRNSIAFHRIKTSQLLKKYIDIKKVSRKEFRKELINSKIVISPFGWGEINVPRDYEIAMSGAVIIKPDISHLKTFPDIFNSKSVVSYNWDFSDIEEKIHTVLDNYNKYIEYAFNLQKKYKHYMCSKQGQYEFCEYFKQILNNT